MPIHAEIITQCDRIGFDFLGSIIWQKKTTMNTTGGAVVMGSYPYPPNGIVEIDYEFILIFKKPGKTNKISKEIKEASKLTKEEWKEYFSGHWRFGGAKQIEHEAMFPEKLPMRLIKMFSFVGDTVSDPFLGSGTTAKVALELKRNVIGYEINRNYLEIIKNKIGTKYNVIVSERVEQIKIPDIDYVPAIRNLTLCNGEFSNNRKKFYKVTKIINENTIELDSKFKISFLGVKIIKKEDTIRYLKDYVLNKKVFLKYPIENNSEDEQSGYVYLKNGIFINAYLIKAGFGVPDSGTLTFYHL